MGRILFLFDTEQISSNFLSLTFTIFDSDTKITMFFLLLLFKEEILVPFYLKK